MVKTSAALINQPVALRVFATLLLFACILSFPVVHANADSADLNDPANQQAILHLARDAFDTYAKTRVVIDPPSPLPDVFKQRCGVFVSTMRDGAPRTCMGTLSPCQPNLALEIIQNAVASAGRDRRFAPVKPTELKSLDLIVSVIVGTPTPISKAQALALDPARDGLVVQYGDRYGVVLSGETPDVGNMLKWGRIRAGAPPNAAITYLEIHDIRFMETEFQ